MLITILCRWGTAIGLEISNSFISAGATSFWNRCFRREPSFRLARGFWLEGAAASAACCFFGFACFSAISSTQSSRSGFREPSRRHQNRKLFFQRTAALLTDPHVAL